jgi:anti-sigma factor RsiW
LRHAGESISAYLDGELHGAELNALMRHLAECGACTLEMEEVQSVRAAVRSLPVVEVPDDLMPEVDAEVVHMRRRGAWVGAAAAAVAVVLALVTILTPQPAAISIDELNSRFAARVSLDPAFGPAKVIVPSGAQVPE